MADKSYLDDVSEYRAHMARRMDVVEAARFSASQRLENRSRSINLMLALLAAQVLVLSLLPLWFDLQPLAERTLAIAGVSASILVIILSLCQYASRDDTNAEKFHQNALKIAEIRKRLEICQPEIHTDFEPIIFDYNAALRECGINHDPVDFVRGRIVSDNYPHGHLHRFADHVLIIVRRLPALTYAGLAVFLTVLYVICSVLSEFYPSLRSLVGWI